MSTARNTKPQAEKPNLRERARAARSATQRSARQLKPDPIFAAIAANRALEAEFDAFYEHICDRGLTEAEYAEEKRLSARQLQSWRNVYSTTPTTQAGLRELREWIGWQVERHNETPEGDGSIWADAYLSLSRALDAVGAGPAQPSVPASAHWPAACSASKLGDMLEEAWVEHDEWDERITPENREHFGYMADWTLEQIDTLQVAISFARASSPAGILAQLCVASDALDSAANGCTPSIRRTGEEVARRCFFSITAALCAMTGEERDVGILRRYLSPRSDRFAFLSPEAA